MYLKYTHGKNIFIEFIEKAKSGGGVVEYYWPKPDSNNSYRKISNVKLFEKWGWVIGTGIYLDDIERDIDAIAYRIISVIAFIFIIITLISIYMSNKFLKQMIDLSMYDQLTSLYTRRYLSQEIDIIIHNHNRDMGKFLAVIFLDIDFFKKINDSYGHTKGDEVLCGVGKSMLSSIRVGDIAVRYGGEEFLITMLCNTQEEAIEIASRIRQSVNEMKFKSDKDEFSITLSAGIAFREEDEKFEHLLERADKKLYEAKEGGRDCIKY